MPGKPVWSPLLPKSGVAGLCRSPRSPSCMQTLESSLLCAQCPCFVSPDRGDSGFFLQCGGHGWSWRGHPGVGRSLPSLGRSQVVTFDCLYLWSRLWGWEAWWEGTSLPAVLLQLHWPPTWSWPGLVSWVCSPHPAEIPPCTFLHLHTY